LIYRKQAKGSAKAGLPYDVFRATGPMNPMAGPPIANLPALFGANPTFTKFNSYPSAIWYAYLDGTQTQPGDILVGEQTFFIAAQQHITPIMAVEAPRVVDIHLPYQATGGGFVPVYGGNTLALETATMTAWPASILQGTKGENTGTGLPDDIRDPWWQILMPSWPGVLLKSSHIIVDDLGRRFTVSSAELTDLGWRITAMLAQT
jgi:hypothetical protein